MAITGLAHGLTAAGAAPSAPAMASQRPPRGDGALAGMQLFGTVVGYIGGAGGVPGLAPCYALVFSIGYLLPSIYLVLKRLLIGFIGGMKIAFACYAPASRPKRTKRGTKKGVKKGDRHLFY